MINCDQPPSSASYLQIKTNKRYFYVINKEKDKFPFIALGHSMSLLCPLAHSVGSGGMDIVNCSVQSCLSHSASELSVLETTQILTQ